MKCRTEAGCLVCRQVVQRWLHRRKGGRAPGDSGEKGVDARFLTAVLREMCLHRGLLKRVNFYKSCCMRPSGASRRAGLGAAVGAARPGPGPGPGPAAGTRAGGRWEPFLSIKWRQ